MTYDEAISLFSKRCPDQRKLAHETYLRRIVSTDDITRHVSLLLFGQEILRFFPNKSFRIFNRGYPTRTTLDRFQRFLPRGFHIWSVRGSRKSPRVWIVRTEKDFFPYREGCTFTEGGEPLPDELGGHIYRDALNLVYRAPEYARRAAHAVVFGGQVDTLGSEYDCAGCAIGNSPCIADHLQEAQFPPQFLLRLVSPNSYLHEQVARSLGAPKGYLSRKPRTQREFAATIEQTFRCGYSERTVDPKTLRRELATNFERGILHFLGFAIQ